MNKNKLLVALVAVAALASGPVAARDTKMMVSIDNAMLANDAKARLGDGVKFYFGKTPGNVGKRIGVGQTSKKTNSFGKSPEEACNWAFLSAMLALKADAESKGANAVVNIQSNYANVPFSSTSEFECHDGKMITGVALKGEYVRIGN